MKNMTIPEGLKINKVTKTEESALTEREAAELAARVKAMTREEMELVLDTIPVEMCLSRIEKEITRIRAFEIALKTAIDIFGTRD